MTCSGCVSRVKTTLSAFAESAEVTLEPPLAVLGEPIVDMITLNTALGNHIRGKRQIAVGGDIKIIRHANFATAGAGGTNRRRQKSRLTLA